MPHMHRLRIYYEDTDLAGIVYHANYLKFVERGRSEWVRQIGLDQNHMRDAQGLVFVVRRMAVEFLSPARLDDDLTVETDLVEVKGASFIMDQKVMKADIELFTARVTVVTMTLEGRPVRLPAEIRSRIVEQAAG